MSHLLHCLPKQVVTLTGFLAISRLLFCCYKQMKRLYPYSVGERFGIRRAKLEWWSAADLLKRPNLWTLKNWGTNLQRCQTGLSINQGKVSEKAASSLFTKREQRYLCFHLCFALSVRVGGPELSPTHWPVDEQDKSPSENELTKNRTFINMARCSRLLCFLLSDAAHPLLITGEETTPTYLEGKFKPTDLWCHWLLSDDVCFTCTDVILGSS